MKLYELLLNSVSEYDFTLTLALREFSDLLHIDYKINPLKEPIASYIIYFSEIIKM